MIIKFEDEFRQLATIKGVMRDFTFRVLHCKHELWWPEDHSQYKLNLWHEQAPEGYTKSTHFLDRALDLCEYEMTHANFGLGLKDLLELDLTTFTEVERRVHDYAKKQNAKLAPVTNAFDKAEKEAKKK